MASRILTTNSLAIVVPIIAAIALVLAWGRDLGIVLVVIIAVVLAATVLAAVHHAEVVAHKVGEPFGSLILAVAVTVIEVALILTLVASGGPGTESLARDTVFAAVMITMNGIVGLSLLIGSFRHGVVRFSAEGAGAALATLTALATLGLVLPVFTSATGPQFTPPQLLFAAVASLVLYGMFVLTQTVGNRELFLPVTVDGTPREPAHSDAPPTNRQTLISLGLLILALVAVVGLAKLESPSIEAGVEAIGFPPSFVGVVIALLVLLPESIAAAKAAKRNEIQTSFNLAIGSSLASIGLTIPAIALASVFNGGSLLLGLGSTQIVLLVLTVVVSILTFVPGRASRLQGGVHIVMFAAFLFLSIAP
jgi:Ca2+:H+ antiporter